MKKTFYNILFLMLLLMQPSVAGAQKFFNLTADQVRTDSVLPLFASTMPLPANYADSVYTVSFAYPEFIDMPDSDISSYKKLVRTLPPAMPEITSHIVFDRKKPSLETSFCPVVYRDGRYRLLVSFMLKVEARPVSRQRRSALRDASTPASRYAEHSVLASGRWAKIRVPSTGVYQLSESLIRQAGFSDLSKVKVYGYGGNLKNETLSGSDLVEYDDLREVPLCDVNGRLLFYALGPVSWESNSSSRRTRNPYSDYGYYFITQNDEGTPARVSQEDFIASFYPSPYYYHTLYEVDGYSWYQGGRNLFDSQQITGTSPYTVDLSGNPEATYGKLSVNVSAGSACRVQIEFNDSILGTLNISLAAYDEGNEASGTYTINNPQSQNKVKITVLSGGPARLDYVSMAWDKPFAAPDLTASFPVPQYVYNITNQDLHADGPADMVIIIPTSQKLRSEAERLKEFHETHDALRVRIVPADELFNEFSSGTPDASAYRNYLKMLYDRAATEVDMPKYLLLFGDCVWDNRMLTSDCRNLNADDYLLCFESENSFNEVSCYIDDGYFCMLDDGEGENPLLRDKLDVAVGRFPVTTESDAKVMVDKVINYVTNANAGAWQNTMMFMGDDGNADIHMRDVNDVADLISSLHPGYNIKKVLWDAYKRETSSTGKSYPDASKAIKQQQAAGALIMDYAGHGRADQISHESVLRLSDFASFTNTNLPLWVTASCDIMPFDGMKSTIGETAVLNPKGGAVAFYGTTRTVYASHNKTMNTNFLTNVLTVTDGKPMTIGEAQRLAKNSVKTNGNMEVVNNLQYSLLGDPAMSLSLPTLTVVVDSINGVDVTTGTTVNVGAGSIMRVSGYVKDAPQFNGVLAASVHDSRELITCLWNNRNEDEAASSPFTYYDRPKVLFNGNDSIVGGRFEFSFAVPKDINYTDGTGLINLYALSNDRTLIGNGYCESFIVGGGDVAENDSVGPSIYCYLNSPSFVNGGNVNSTPYFVAEIMDKDGINSSGNGIGHDLQLVIDGEMARTYNLNDNFSYDFGSYTRGTTYYNIPELEEGEHTLQFRAWDVFNNMSSTQLRFKVVKGLTPSLFSVSCTNNPATTSTTFIISHDRAGSTVNVGIDVFDMSGRLLWTHEESGVTTGNAYTVDWDLTVDGGQRLGTGVYIYRVRMSSDGSSQTSKAKKLIIIGNK